MYENLTINDTQRLGSVNMEERTFSSVSPGESRPLSCAENKYNKWYGDQVVLKMIPRK